jgi:hypothetical protein
LLLLVVSDPDRALGVRGAPGEGREDAPIVAADRLARALGTSLAEMFAELEREVDESDGLDE